MPKNTSPSLTVVVPSFNSAPTLDACLRSVVAASPSGARILVVDDASTDESAAIIARHPVEVLRHASNRGPSAARNSGWRAADTELVAFVDSDVVILPEALTLLMERLIEDPGILAANGTLALDDREFQTQNVSFPDARVTGFTNTSLHHQLKRHGDRVSTAFTSLCLFRRGALEGMGGWDESRPSRYADDVVTRFLLPPRSILQEPGARALHLKRVALKGLLKHRFNMGFHFLDALLDHHDSPGFRLESLTLDARYPCLTLAAALESGALLLAPATLGLSLAAFIPAFAISAGTQGGLFTFTMRHRGLGEALVSLPLSTLEGHACLLGMSAYSLRFLRALLLRRAR